VPIYRLDDTRIANGNSDLWDSTIQNPISVDESGSILNTYVWTGSSQGGDTAIIGALGSVFTYPHRGLSSSTDDNWVSVHFVYMSSPPNTALLGFYAMSDVLTVPTPVPIPAAFYLLGTAIAGLLGVGWGRRTAST
jgi:hypothetical protein